MFNNYNPYYQQPRYSQQMPPTQVSEQPQYIQPMTPFIKQTGLQGKQVDSLEVVKATDVPFDGSVSYFPLTDGSAIVTKQLQNDGTSKLVVFKPVDVQKEETHYLTQDDLKNALNELNLDKLDDFEDELREIKKELKELKKK